MFLRGVDLRDLWRPGGGESRLTVRRLLLIVDALPRDTSLFWTAAADVDQISTDQVLLTDLWSAWTGKPHPLRTRREDAAKRREFEAKRARIKARNERWARIREAAEE